MNEIKGVDFSEILNDPQEDNEKLCPGMNELRYITTSLDSISRKVNIMNNAVELAHQSMFSFEVTQEILNVQKRAIKRELAYLNKYLI